MQLTFPKAPFDGAGILLPVLQSALHLPACGINPSDDDVALSLSEPYLGYTLTLADLAGGDCLDKAVTGTWHYLVFLNGVAAADAQLTSSGGETAFSSLNYGQMASATVDALGMAENAACLHGKDYELRVLSVSALHLVALWLHAEDEDVFIPIAPTPGDLIQTDIYDKEGLFSILTPAAAAAKQEYDADGSGQAGN